ncbi:MAG: beta strand repeat-containing protein, partial [Acidobacteriota bacterium]
GAQSVTGRAYQNVTTSGTGTKTPDGAYTVNGTLTVGSGTTLDASTRTGTLPGGATLAVNGTLDFTDTGGLIQSGTSGTTTLTMGSSGLIKTLDSAGLGPATGASLQTQAGGAWTVTSIDTNGTVEYYRNVTSGQTVTDRNYNNLTITGSTQTKSWSLGATRTVNGTVTINASAPLTLSGTQTVNVKGNWSNSGTFTAGTSTINFNGAANQSIGGSNSTTFATLSITNTGTSPTNNVSLAKDTTVSTALNIVSGVFNQGAIAGDDFSLNTNNVTVSSGATWQNLGKGDVTLTGNVANSGIINLNANGTSCGDADDILIRSVPGGTQRTWSGTGTFSMTDVDVQDQRTPVAPPPATIFVTSGTNTGNNTGWVFLASCTSGSYVWTGTVSTDWQVPANWSPTRTVPATADVLVFDGNATPSPTVTNVPTQTLAALRLVNSINGVTLNASTLGAQTLTLSGGTGTDLSVPVGSLLTLNGSNALTIALTAAGSQGTVSGQIIVQGGAHRLIGSNAGEVTFNSGSLFTTSTSFTGNAFGSGTAGSIIFANGAAYVHNAGAS